MMFGRKKPKEAPKQSSVKDELEAALKAKRLRVESEIRKGLVALKSQGIWQVYHTWLDAVEATSILELEGFRVERRGDCIYVFTPSVVSNIAESFERYTKMSTKEWQQELKQVENI